MEEEKRFSEKILDNIQRETARIPITFPKTVYDRFSEFAKRESNDCYWLAVKQLLDFHEEQTEGDFRTAVVLEAIKDVKNDISELDDRVTTLEKPKVKDFQTFGKGDKK